MAEFTMGPLEVGYYEPTKDFKLIKEHVAVMKPDGSLVAVTGPSTCAASVADAHRFAAAPELYEVVEEVVSQIELGGYPTKENFDKLKAALAKARGEK